VILKSLCGIPLTHPSLSVLSESYPFVWLDSFSELDLRTLPFQINGKVTLVRFDSLQHSGSNKVSVIQDLPYPEIVAPFRFGFRFDALPKSPNREVLFHTPTLMGFAL